jgi:hypothetical protein
MVHAWLLWDNHHANQVHRALDEVVLLVQQINCDCLAADQIHKAAQRLASDWRHRFGSEDHHELLDAAVQDMRSREPIEDPVSLQLEHFRVLTTAWSEAVAHLQSMIDHALVDDAQRLLRLGMHIDQGIRPWPLDDLICVVNPMVNEPEPPNYRFLGDAGSGPSVGDGQQQAPWHGVAEHVAPELWFADLEQRCVQLDIPASPFLRQERPSTHIAMRDFVQQLSGSICFALEPPDQAEEDGLDESSSSENAEGDAADQSAPNDADSTDEGGWESDDDEAAEEDDFRDGDSYASGRLILCEDRLRAILHDEVIPIETRQHFLFLEAVAGRDGDWITSEEIRQSTSELDGARIDRICRRLDGRLQGIIRSKRGAGYRLILVT